MNDDLQNIETLLKLMNRVDIKGSEVQAFVVAQQWLVTAARDIQKPPQPEQEMVVNSD